MHHIFSFTLLAFLAISLLTSNGLTVVSPSHGMTLENPESKESSVSYDNFKVYKITLKSETDIKDFNKFKSTLYSIDTWKEPHGKKFTKNSKGMRIPTEYSTTVMVPSSLQNPLETFLQAMQMDYTVMVENVGSVIEEQAKDNSLRILKRARSGINSITWDAYYDYSSILTFCDQIAKEHSDLVTVTIIGKSTEGRDIKLVKISKPGSDPNKKAVLIEGGIHAREWISPATVTYIINELATKREEYDGILEKVDFYFICVLNPDGYEYTKKDRMWRKTRSDYDTSLKDCRGVDPNRNFDFQFGGPGTSTNKCSEIYKGPKAFSEPETAALRDVLMRKDINWLAYFACHSYGNTLLFPWSYTEERSADYDDLMIFARNGVDAIEAKSGAIYTYGESTEVYGPSAGCSDDWTKAMAGVKYAYTVEMSDGPNGFILPPEQIRPVAEEAWAGIKSMCLYGATLSI